MRVGVNLLYLRPGEVGGSEVYVRALVRELAERVDLVLLCNGAAAETFDLPGHDVVAVTHQRYRMGRRLFNENWTLRRFVDGRSLDLLFSPANFAAPALPSRLPQVATVHDLQHHWLRNHFTRSKRFQRTMMFHATFLRCRRLIAISDFTRDDVIRRYRVEPDRITTVLEGVDLEFVRDEDRADALRRELTLPDRYFFYPAKAFPHKNHIRLVESFRMLLERAGDQGAHLVFSGERTTDFEPIQRRIDDWGLGRRVCHLGYLQYRDVLQVMAMAEAVVFPSTFEGFGLPVLEAMQCGVPVLASRCTAIPEVCGDAGILIDPEDTNAWAAAMERILRDRALRRRLQAAGADNLARFSWSKCADETLRVFEACLSSAG